MEKSTAKSLEAFKEFTVIPEKMEKVINCNQKTFPLCLGECIFKIIFSESDGSLTFPGRISIQFDSGIFNLTMPPFRIQCRSKLSLTKFINTVRNVYEWEAHSRSNIPVCIGDVNITEAFPNGWHLDFKICEK